MLSYENFNSYNGWYDLKVRKKIRNLLLQDRKLGIEFLYHLNTGKKLDFKTLDSYGKVIQYIKLILNPIKINAYSDKLLVRNYLEKKGLAFLLPKIFFVFKSCKDIDFKDLPSNSVIKMSNGWNQNIYMKNIKNKKCMEQTLHILKSWQNQEFGLYTAEMQYIGFKNTIYCEEYLGENIREVKFYCINGEPEFYEIDENRYSDHKRNFFNLNNDPLNITLGVLSNKNCKCISRDKLDLMIKYSKELSRDFAHVRVDFNYALDRILFSELTFTPAAGYKSFYPKKFDKKFSYKVLNAIKSKCEFI